MPTFSYERLLQLPETVRSLIQYYTASNLDSVYAKFALDNTRHDIRLVCIQKGDWCDDIRCRLEVVSLPSKPEFEALSYAWGQGSELKPIRLEGKRINVGSNLESALRHLRYTDRDRVLWADAISINQRDIQERNEQVLLMKDIYSTCRSVLIWLGDYGDRYRVKSTSRTREWHTEAFDQEDSVAGHGLDEQTVLDFTDHLKAYYRLPFSLRHSMYVDGYLGAYCLLSLLAQNKHVNDTDIPFLRNHDAFHRVVLALDEIMHCQWWTRQWVIQEVVLPATVKVHFGGFVAPWELFGSAARNYETHRTNCCGEHYTALHWNDIRLLENFSRTVVEMDNLRRNWQRASKGEDDVLVTLRQLLWRFRDRSTTDPRDKIYTLLPLVTHWNSKTGLNPDYYPKTEKVFCAAVKTVIAVDESLEIFMGTMEKELTSLPSWVPDWTRKPSRFEEERLERCALFKAALNHKLEVEFFQDTYMKAAGVAFDVVIDVVETMDYADEEQCQRTFADWYAALRRTGPVRGPYPSGGTKLDAYWRTLCLDTARSFSNMDIGKRYRRCSKRYLEMSQQKWMDAEGMPLRWKTEDEEVTYDLGNEMNLDSEAAEISPTARTGLKAAEDQNLNFVAVDFAVCSATWNRRMFFTEKGYIGLGPPTVEKGDTVNVLGGGSMPFVLRSAGLKRIPTVGVQACHRLLGECYLHGIMDGEAVLNYERDKVDMYLA